MRHRAAVVAFALACCGARAAAGETGDERPWTIGAIAYAYFVPDETDFVMAVVPADVRVLHVEARYNYEALRSGSAFVGLNAHWGDRARLAFTPMLGLFVSGTFRFVTLALYEFNLGWTTPTWVRAMSVTF